MIQMHQVLHGLAIKKHATAGDVARLLGVAESDVAALLEDATKRGRAVHDNGKYVLSPLAHVALEADYSRRFAAQRVDSEFVSAYEQFERINVDLKALMTDWQTIATAGQRVANDHSNRDYDMRVIDRLGRLHEAVEELLLKFERTLPRFSYYRTRLLAALEAAEQGKIEWVSGARIESYHTLWFELHEDLLRIMGQVRKES